MKLTRIALLSCLVLSAATGSAFSASDVKFWVGSGSNQAVFVVDYNDGVTPHSFAWGFRWNGTAKGYDMLSAIDAADPYLNISVLQFSFGPYFDSSTYDHDHDGTIDHSGLSSNGWWAYYTKNAEGDAWASSRVGMGDRELVNGSWDGWSFSTDMTNWTSTPPTEPVAAAVPEPVSLIGLGLGAAALIARRRRA